MGSPYSNQMLTVVSKRLVYSVKQVKYRPLIMKVVFDLEWKDGGALQQGNGRETFAGAAVSSRIFKADASCLVHALTALGVGGVIAVPTDTLYGRRSPRMYAQQASRSYISIEKPIKTGRNKVTHLS